MIYKITTEGRGAAEEHSCHAGKLFVPFFLLRIERGTRQLRIRTEADNHAGLSLADVDAAKAGRKLQCLLVAILMP